jgi:hypothetical protein
MASSAGYTTTSDACTTAFGACTTAFDDCTTAFDDGTTTSGGELGAATRYMEGAAGKTAGGGGGTVTCSPDFVPAHHNVAPVLAHSMQRAFFNPAWLD